MTAELNKLKPSLCATRRPEVTEALLADITQRIVEAFHPHKVILFGSYISQREPPEPFTPVSPA
ncbi:MAG TPA: hypothetical protein VFB38_25150 [Chthonomonadaceae bacterium]|nr:hypothetical protein [Chthonomonadaceae bacterium]